MPIQYSNEPMDKTTSIIVYSGVGLIVVIVIMAVVYFLWLKQRQADPVPPLLYQNPSTSTVLESMQRCISILAMRLGHQ